MRGLLLCSSGGALHCDACYGVLEKVAGSARGAAEKEPEVRKAALARFEEKKRERSANPNRKVRYEMRRINAEKRPVSAARPGRPPGSLLLPVTSATC